MVPTAQKHLQVADLYEQLSADEYASIEWRIAFARKAKWHRILARTSAEKDHSVAKESASDGEQVLRCEASLFSPTRLWDARDRTELANIERPTLSVERNKVNAQWAQSTPPRRESASLQCLVPLGLKPTRRRSALACKRVELAFLINRAVTRQ